ncbi:MAG TPA: hypothetical protein VFA10_14530 [Ktedonobacteraceae bacterium]|nr:hypothetical protein [Ktedonobacteraceae bacterium]
MDELSIQEAIQHKAQGDACYAYLLHALSGKPRQFDKQYRAGQGLGRTQAQAQGTPLFTAWEDEHDALYTSTFLATWEEVERQESEVHP